MALNLQVDDGNVGGSELNNSSEDELTGIFALRKKELEVMVIRTVQQVIIPVLKPLIREVVKTEFESAQEKILTSMKRNFGNEIHPSELRNLQLRFSNKLALPILTGMQIKGEGGTSIQVALVDGLTGQVVNSGPEASAKVEIVVLGGDFDGDERHSWTLEEFNQKIVSERVGNKSLLIGNVYVNLTEGIGYVGKIYFTHKSSWMKSCRFRLGARLVDNLNGTRVREAKTECFSVKDRRSEYYKKCDSPSLSDEVWRLKNIGKNGAFHKRLIGKKIKTVKDFLTQFFINPQWLQEILGIGMSTGKWKVTVDHARRCELDNKKYLYCPPSSQQKTGVVFNVVGQVMGLLLQCHFVPIDQLSETEKADAHKLVVSAFEHWGEVVPTDETSLMHGASLGPSNSPRLESPNGSNNETSHMTVGHDHTQTTTSPPGIVSSNNSIGGVSNLDNISNTESIDEPLSGPGQFSEFPSFDLESVWKYLDEVDNNYNLQSENPVAESHACQQSAAGGFLLVGARTVAVAIDNKAQRKWTMVSCLLRWFSKRKTVAPEGNHVQKKQRFC